MGGNERFWGGRSAPGRPYFLASPDGVAMTPLKYEQQEDVMARCYPKHHWILEPQDGRAQVGGVCKKCGAKKPGRFPTSYAGYQKFNGTMVLTDPDRGLYPEPNSQFLR